jgi:hypothetical protein
MRFLLLNIRHPANMEHSSGINRNAWTVEHLSTERGMAVLLDAP